MDCFKYKYITINFPIWHSPTREPNPSDERPVSLHWQQLCSSGATQSCLLFPDAAATAAKKGNFFSSLTVNVNQMQKPESVSTLVFVLMFDFLQTLHESPL